MIKSYVDLELFNDTKLDTNSQSDLSLRRQTSGSNGKLTQVQTTTGDVLFSDKIIYGPHSHSRNSIKSVIGVDDGRTKVVNTLDKPFSRVCALELFFPKYNFPYPLAGSGALISPNVVLTCAHNFYEYLRKETVETVIAAPAQASATTTPFGKISAKRILFPKEHKTKARGDREFDYAAVILDTPIGDEIGYFGILEAHDRDFSDYKIHVSGFPAMKEDLGIAKTMYHHSASLKNLTDHTVEYFTDASSGQSGSPVYFYEHNNSNVEPLIVAVHNGGVGNIYNEGARINGRTFDDIMGWIKEGEIYL